VARLPSGFGRRRVQRFVAQYESNCLECGELIEERDEAGFIDGDVACASCCNREDEEDE
jgi:hypothetical protein